MENRYKVTFVASDIQMGLEGVDVMAPNEKALEDFAVSLRALGIKVELEALPRKRVRVAVGYPSEIDATRARTRHAGRLVKFNPSESPVFDSGTTAVDALAWLDAHTTAEGMEALTCSRSTYFRWRDRLRRLVADRAERDARRAQRGEAPLAPLYLDEALWIKS